MMANEVIQINDLKFREYIDSEQIQKRIIALSKEIDAALTGKEAIFLGLLNGCFIFMADLIRNCQSDQEVKFIKLSSYEGKESTGKIVSSGSLGSELNNRHIVIVEDIIDSGLTMNWITQKLTDLGVASIRIVTLLLKPDALEFPLKIDHVGFEIPNNFVVGYGLDYNGKGRNLKSIYTLIEN